MKDTIKKIFGTDGVRGKANFEPMTVETILALGRAVGIILRSHNKKHRVVIGKDTRLSCYMFENALIAGLCSMGIDTLMVGPLPTPGVAFITKAYRADAGIVISASHNPYDHNGIKIFSSEGYKFSDEWEHSVEQLIYSAKFNEALPSDSDIGKNTKIDDANGRYIEFAKNTFPKNQSLANLRIALDCANGAGYRVAPMIFRELDAEVFTMGDRPNGININLNCGSLYPEGIQKLVLESGAHVGIALDGDADRVIMVDERGELVDGDTLLAISAKDLKEKGLLRNNTIVSTIMCNYGFLESMKKLDINVIQSQVGDRHVIRKMIEANTNLGGEQSGHIIFSDHNTTGDGLVSALQILKIMVEKQTTLSELASIVKKCPQICLNVHVTQKPPLEAIPGFREKFNEANAKLNNKGRIVIRYSGTEKICRIMVEGKDIEMIHTLANDFATLIKSAIGS